MRNSAILPLALLLLLFTMIPAAAGVFPLAAGYNFISPQAATAMTSAEILTAQAGTKSVFRFDPLQQSFIFQLRLADNTLFGSTFTLQDGQGVVIEAGTALNLTISESGGAVSPDPFSQLADGFNFIGLPGRGGTQASALLTASTDLQGIFRWNSGNSAFDFLIKLQGGTQFGTDFTLADGVGYFLNKPASTPDPTPVAVDISGFRFTPGTITITAGQTVTWTNRDSAAHTVTSDSGVFDSGTLSRDATFSRTFSTKGTFPYHCGFHPSMTATVVVQ